MRFYNYKDPKAPWSYIIIFTIIEIILTIGIPLIPTIIAWKLMFDITYNTRLIVSLLVYMISLFIAIGIKDVK